MRHRGKYKNWLKLSLGIIGIVGAGWLLTTVPLHNSSQAKGHSIFDKGGGRYFGNGSSGPNHNVLPPMHYFQQSSDQKVYYAIDPPRVGIPDSELSASQRYSLWNNDNLYQEIFKGQGAGFIISAVKSRKDDIHLEAQKGLGDLHAAWISYWNKPENDIGEINRCIQSYEQDYKGSKIISNKKVGFEYYKKHYKKCADWLETGYKFLAYSLVGVPQSQSNNGSLYEQKKEDFIADTTKIVTVQKMTAGGRVAQYYEGTNSSATKFTPDGMNTAINGDRNDVIGYNGAINPSLAVVVWEKPNGLNQKYRAQWILRLRCANPIGASLYTKTAKVDAQVKGEPNPVFLPLNGTAKVTFKYKIYKSLRGFSGKDTSIKYSFSGHNRAYDKLDFNPNDVKVTKVEPNGLTLGSTLKPEKAVVLGKGIPYAQIEYQEEVEISQANKNKVWYAVDATSGHICRTIQAKPDKSNNMPDPPKSKLTAESTSCVDIKFGESPGKDGTIYVFPLAPDIASITDPILPDYKGINSYVIRKKQWSYWHKPGVSESGYCGNSRASVKNSLSRQCNDKCKNDPENIINCKKENEDIERFCCKESCNDKGNCHCVRYQHRGTAQCYHYQREEGAKWQITKMIFKPETDTTIENTPLSGLVDEHPCKHFKVPNGGICQTALSGDYRFDSTSGDFSIKNGFNALSGLIHTNITPTKGGLSDNVKPHLGGLGDLPYQVEALPSGTKVCFAASIYPWINAGSDSSLESYKENKPQWRHSQPRCFVVSKKPFFTVENGMLLSGGNIITNLNRRQFSEPRRAGSWAEYNAISQGDIGKLFATNSASFGANDYTREAWHRLSFANQDKLGQFEADATSELIDPASFFSHLKTGRYANTTITSHAGGDISGSLSGVHVYNGNTTITGDISANSSANHGSLANTSQAVIVVNGDLTINNKVRNIDAWLIVTGTLMTSQNPVTANTVGKGIDKDEVPLTITGPVKAGQVKLRRTYGSGIHSPFNSIKTEKDADQLTKPAETFRHTPKTYIWSYYNSLDKGQVQTVYLREVAPRY